MQSGGFQGLSNFLIELGIIINSLFQDMNMMNDGIWKKILVRLDDDGYLYLDY